MPRKIDRIRLQELLERGLNQVENAKEFGLANSLFILIKKFLTLLKASKQSEL